MPFQNVRYIKDSLILYFHFFLEKNCLVCEMSDITQTKFKVNKIKLNHEFNNNEMLKSGRLIVYMMVSTVFQLFLTLTEGGFSTPDFLCNEISV